MLAAFPKLQKMSPMPFYRHALSDKVEVINFT